VDRKKILIEAFQEELEKDAKVTSVLNTIKALFAGGRKAVTPYLAKGRSAMAKSRAGLWFARQPSWFRRAAGFGGKATAAGAAMTVGELPFARRRKVVQILPERDRMGGYR
jgi:hypothetical protein